MKAPILNYLLARKEIEDLRQITTAADPLVDAMRKAEFWSTV